LDYGKSKRLKNISTYINVFVQKFKSNSKTLTSTGIFFDFIIFKLNIILRMQGLYMRLKKLKVSKDLTQMAATNPDFLKN
jgi:hypothetical protein